MVSWWLRLYAINDGSQHPSLFLPNTALHRTPAAAPLSPVSFKTFGDGQVQDAT